VEFAGHYTIPRWGCGTECNGFVIVDSISGRVYDGLGVAGLPFPWLQAYGGDDAIPRMEFYTNSRLLKINACPNEEDCGFYDCGGSLTQQETQLVLSSQSDVLKTGP
jgi:hypothetical protein